MEEIGIGCTGISLGLARSEKGGLGSRGEMPWLHGSHKSETTVDSQVKSVVVFPMMILKRKEIK